jgi:hypothetical protein
MGLSQDLVLLGIGGALLLVVVICVVVFQYWKVRTDALREVQRQFAGVRITAVTSRANFRGFARSWDGQWQGHGVLVLTDEILYFRTWNGESSITIPLDRIEQVTVNSRQGERKLRGQHLHVSYLGLDDHPRVATWSVQNPRRWTADLNAMRDRKIQSDE